MTGTYGELGEDSLCAEKNLKREILYLNRYEYKPIRYTNSHSTRIRQLEICSFQSLLKTAKERAGWSFDLCVFSVVNMLVHCPFSCLPLTPPLSPFMGAREYGFDENRYLSRVQPRQNSTAASRFNNRVQGQDTSLGSVHGWTGSPPRN